MELPFLPPSHLIPADISPVIHCGEDAAYIESLMKFACTIHPSFYQQEISRRIAQAIVCYCYDRINQKSEKENKPYHEIVYRAKAFMDTHYTEDITLNDIAEHVNANPYYLSHIFKKVISYSPKQYLTCLRIGAIQTLLQESSMTAAEIAAEFGFFDACHFNSIFKKYVGMTPGEYRRTFR